ncbi:MAG TPA: transglycosylase domain-containing protein [Longimicrobiaceae bacterium]|nr:transglycosylase domain-containing protein [Longimicrobiaceae bacterium]
MRLGKPKVKALGGAPRAGKWTREPEPKKLGGRHRGSFTVLLVLGGAVLAGMAVFAFLAQQRLSSGLLAQYRQQQRRPDWVRLRELPPYVVDAFLTVVDTAGFQRVPEYVEHETPLLTRDLVSQVHRLDAGVGDQAWRTAMVPLLEAQLPRRAALEFYLNRIALGSTGDWPVYGVAHAAEDYFGKDPRRLTAGEAATLAGILLPPRLTDPEARPGAVGARRNEVLRRLLHAGRLDEAAFRAATAEPLAFQPGIDHAPMTRPADWEREPEPIRLPPELRPGADSAAAGG